LNVFFFKQIIEKGIIGLKNRALKKIKNKRKKRKAVMAFVSMLVHIQKFFKEGPNKVCKLVLRILAF